MSNVEHSLTRGFYDLAEIPGIQHDRDRVTPATYLEQHALALHHQQQRRGSDITRTRLQRFHRLRRNRFTHA